MPRLSVQPSPAGPTADANHRWQCFLSLSGLSALAFTLLGYHPYAEDGGIYAAALARSLQPSLFPWDAAFVRGHTRFSAFIPGTAWLTRTLHVLLPYTLLVLQIVGVFALLATTFAVARRCFARGPSAWWATALVALCAGLPIAGTSLYLVDPYPTARTLTTPLLLGSAALLLRRRATPALCCWTLAAALHPLMAVWGGLLLLLLHIRLRFQPRRAAWLAGGLALCMLAAMAAIQRTTPAASNLSRTVALTRAYWFLSAWHWYEVIGAVAPLALLAVLATRSVPTTGLTAGGRGLAQAACGAAGMGLAAALLYAHAGGANFAIARLQPLRTLHLAYAVLALLLGGAALNAMQRMTARVRNTVALLVALFAAAALLCMQHGLYPISTAVEWPWAAPRNGWSQAFLWVRNNTSIADRVALDARYTELPGEEAQGFRAISRRSTLPDAAKDAGVAAVVPALEASWQAGVRAQTGLDRKSDAERKAALQAFSVRWIILPASAATALTCPYTNYAAKVCRL